MNSPEAFQICPSTLKERNAKKTAEKSEHSWHPPVMAPFGTWRSLAFPPCDILVAYSVASG